MEKQKRASGRQRARILVVDDHPIVREGLASLLAKQPDLEVCGEAGNVQEALKVLQEAKPDVAIVDLSLESGSGLDLIRRIKARNASARIIVCSLYDETLYAERALHAGAVGYVNKQQATRVIVGAIRRVLEGKVYLSDRMSERLAHRLVGSSASLIRATVDLLSDRELEVFQLIGNGLTTGEIAEKLHVGVKTVETHRARIKAKLNLKNTARLAREAAQWVLENG